MSDVPTSTDDEDDGGIFCQSCSPATRKCGYYLTFFVGLVLFVIGFIESIGGQVAWIVIGSLIILFCPLWIKSIPKCLSSFKDLLKVTSALIYIAFLVLNIVSSASGWGDKSPVISYLLGICLALSGGWYFLTFFPNGQKACINCIKTCCSKDGNIQ